AGGELVQVERLEGVGRDRIELRGGRPLPRRRGFPYTTLFRSVAEHRGGQAAELCRGQRVGLGGGEGLDLGRSQNADLRGRQPADLGGGQAADQGGGQVVYSGRAEDG